MNTCVLKKDLEFDKKCIVIYIKNSKPIKPNRQKGNMLNKDLQCLQRSKIDRFSYLKLTVSCCYGKVIDF